MKFAISVSLERFSPAQDMRVAMRNALELVQLAEEGGFEAAFAPEHHTIELTIGPNPLTMVAFWGAHTSRIRLGTAVVSAPYWHPIRLAGEAALVDLMIGGRLELGVARGAYQYEFDRMARGMPQNEGVAYLKEIVPAVQGLWQGNYAHEGTYWAFPLTTSVPKPLQKPHPPIWIAARDPGTFDWAVSQGYNIMTTPLSRPESEVVALGERFDATLARHPGVRRPRHLMLRRTCVYEKASDWEIPVNASVEYGRHFENLFKNIGEVRDGFPQPVNYEMLANRSEYEPAALHRNMAFGTPGEVIEKLRLYERCGVDVFCYGASFGLPHEVSLRSLRLFIDEVMPAFAADRAAPAAASGTVGAG